MAKGGHGGAPELVAASRRPFAVIHLDTNFLIGALEPGTPQDGKLRQWLSSGETVAMSAVGWAEFLCGPVSEEHLKLAVKIVAERIPLLEEDAVLAAKLFNASGRRRRSLPDCLIGATAIRFEAPLATTNVSDFRPFEKLGLSLAV
jgi:predicted nucleic acid-binding protein